MGRASFSFVRIPSPLLVEACMSTDYERAEYKAFLLEVKQLCESIVGSGRKPRPAPPQTTHHQLTMALSLLRREWEDTFDTYVHAHEQILSYANAALRTLEVMPELDLPIGVYEDMRRITVFLLQNSTGRHSGDRPLYTLSWDMPYGWSAPDPEPAKE